MNLLESVDSLNELKNMVDNNHLVICDDMQNDFFIIHLSDENKLGVAYYNHGIHPDIKYSNDETLLYIGVGENFLCIDALTCEILFVEQLQSVFYELICDENTGYVYVVCELDIYCYYGWKQLWKNGFKDIINNFEIVDNVKVSVSCDNDTEYIVHLNNGNIDKL